MCTIDLHIIVLYLFIFILDSNEFDEIQLTHGVTDTCNKYHAFLYGHLNIITRTCNSGQMRCKRAAISAKVEGDH